MMTTEELSKLMKEGFEQIQRQFEEVNRRLGNLETDVAWIKGKLKALKRAEQASGKLSPLPLLLVRLSLHL